MYRRKSVAEKYGMEMYSAPPEFYLVESPLAAAKAAGLFGVMSLAALHPL